MALDVGDPTHREEEEKQPEPVSRIHEHDGTDPLSREGGGSGLVVPVAGVNSGQLTDTHGAPRSGGRSHAGIDIFAPTGTPVLAAFGGTVVRAVRTDTGLGGLRVTVKGDDGRIYYYAHMSAVDVNQGDRVTAGMRLGAVGDSGNAKGTPPHLHFSIGRQSADDGAFNAFSELTGAQSVAVDQVPQGGGLMAAGEDGIQAAPSPTSTQSAQLGISLPQVPDAIAQLPDEELRDYLRKNYGYLAWALDIPEVGDILLRVARGEVTDPDRMFGELFATEWWQQTDDARRQWDALIGQDPAAAQQQVSRVLGDLKAYVARLGLKVPDASLVNIARDSLRFGWLRAGQNPEGSSQLRNALFAEAKRDNYTPAELARGGDRAAVLGGPAGIRKRITDMFTHRRLTPQDGQIDRLVQEVQNRSRTEGSEEDQLQDIRQSLDLQTGFDLDAGTLQFDADRARSLASDYFVPLSEAESERWAARIARGEATEQGLQSYLQEQSASMFSGNRSIGNALERGMTVRQWADPYVQLAARTLELNPNEVDLTDQRFMRGIHNVDPETGEGTAMALGEWQRYLRSLPEWNQTQNATDEVSSKAEFLMSRMGAV